MKINFRLSAICLMMVFLSIGNAGWVSYQHIVGAPGDTYKLDLEKDVPFSITVTYNYIVAPYLYYLNPETKQLDKVGGGWGDVNPYTYTYEILNSGIYYLYMARC